MKMSVREMPDTSPHFEQIIDTLTVESCSLDFDSARGLWSQLAAGIDPLRLARDPHVLLRLEEALVWRILSLRMLNELGVQLIFQPRSKGVATGTASTHPSLDAIAKTYERLKRTMDELASESKTRDNSSATGLPMKMLKLLEESEGALEQVLGVGPGEASPFSPRLVKRKDHTVDSGA
jgi:hypothetical protein